ncbi:MAG: cobalamin biosynthesis protein CobQ [Firmicutes bacterium]|nr:cobalamin biosynthesis protein CobQ [Bacillota bacterium]
MENAKRTMKAAWLFPDILFLHGERGNIMALERIAGLLGIDLAVEKIDFSSEKFDPMNYALIFCPPGEMASFETVLEWLRPYADDLEKFVESGRVLLVTGTSMCMFGRDTARQDGTAIEGLGMIDCSFKERKYVYGDDICFTSDYGRQREECFGVQIQMMDICSREDRTFGNLIYGFGNDGKGRNEGVIKNNSVFTNVLGPMLVLNPWLTEEMIRKAAESIGLETDDVDIDTSLERKSLKSKKKFAMNKKTRLTNCL